MNSDIQNQYFNTLSSFETIATSVDLNWPNITVERIQTSPGYNTTDLPQHVVGIHLGRPVPILHRRDHVEKLHEFQAGDVVFTSAGTPVHYVHAKTVDGLYISIKPQSVMMLAESIAISPARVRLQDNLGQCDPVIARIGFALMQELNMPGLGDRLYIEALSTQLLIHLLRSYNVCAVSRNLDSQTIFDRNLQPAIDFIQAHLNEKLSTREIASTVHLTPFYFSRIFKRQYRVSPHQYVIQQRIEAAQQLLKDPELTLMDIARRVGFVDHSHLTRYYKRLTGKTPRAS